MKKIIMTVGIILSILCVIVFVLCGKNLSISLMLEDEYEKTHYVNDLYDSKELNYRLVLNKSEQKLYDEIIEHIINFDETFTINLTGFRSDEVYASFNKISDVFQAIGMDHFNCCCKGRRILPSSAAHTAKIINKYRTQTLTACQQTITHSIKQFFLRFIRIAETNRSKIRFNMLDVLRSHITNIAHNNLPFLQSIANDRCSQCVICRILWLCKNRGTETHLIS